MKIWNNKYQNNNNNYYMKQTGVQAFNVTQEQCTV